MPEEINGQTYYTEDEVNEKVQESQSEQDALKEQLSELEIQIADKDGDTEELQAQLKETEALLEKEKGKEKNFKNLRKSKEDKAEESSELKEQLESTNKKLDSFLESTKSEVITDYLAGKGIINDDGEIADKNLKEKFDHHFKRLVGDASSKDQIKNVAKEAYILASANEQGTDAVASVVQRSGGNNVIKPGTKESARSQELAQGLGVTAEDKKKYGGESLPLI